ncbi:MAG: hypothetical protein KKH28_06425 [Elusimicrobia bacterium]|nr:hypothetical protein [Elusimicrobiota bacterium]
MDPKKAGYPIRVGLLYGLKPSGHYSAAQALADFFPSSIIEPVFINLSEVSPNLGAFVAKTYLEMLNKTPAIWDYVYDNDFIAFAAKSVKAAIFPYFSKKLAGVLHKKNIQAAVSTHALSAMLLAKNEKGLRNIPLFAVLTDFYAHSYWPARGVELYFSPDRIAEAGLKANGVEQARIIRTGIPVRKEFLIQADAGQKRKALGLAPNLFTVLISGGSKGLGDILMSVETLKKFSGKLQVLVLCGDNRKLFNKLEKSPPYRKNIRLIHFVDSPADYYMASDLIIGKPGGVTIAETMALAKPMLIFAPLPGQEERNTSFLVKNKLADFAKDRVQLESVIRKYLQNPSALTLLKNNISALARPYAARDIAAQIIERLLPA